MINLITQHKNIFKCSYYDYINPNTISNGYTFKTQSDILSWKYTSNSVSSVMFTVISDKTVNVNSIVVDTIGGAADAQIQIKIETSIDYANWYELKYVALYNFNGTKYDVYLKIGDNEYYNLSTKKTVPYDINFQYIYESYDTYTNTYKPLYSTLEAKYIRITLSGMDLVQASAQDPVRLSKFDIIVHDDFSLEDDFSLKLKSDIFTPQAIFEEHTLYPDLIGNYLSMMEDRNFKTNNLLTNLVNISEIQLDGSIYEGIGNDFIGYNLVVYP